MNELLKIAGAASHEVSVAEEALAEEAHGAAREAIDRAGEHLQELRDRWPQMNAAERRVIGAAAADARRRLDAAAALVPPLRATGRVEVVVDPEQEREPGSDEETA